jgi:hypothetical protein
MSVVLDVKGKERRKLQQIATGVHTVFAGGRLKLADRESVP